MITTLAVPPEKERLIARAMDFHVTSVTDSYLQVLSGPTTRDSEGDEGSFESSDTALE
jgi:hypothetical protein